MGFNEMMHAFIAAKFYVYLDEKYAEQGKAAFVHATRHYAEQRGRRMAQTAIRDGQPLTYDTYCRYGEWVNTEDAKALNANNQSVPQTVNPVFETHIFVCPWAYQFKKMGLQEAGLVYCHDLDASICRGFNPEIDYKTTQTLHDHDHCIQIISPSDIDPNHMPAKRPESLKPFEYHCAHSYWAYADTVRAIFGCEGDLIASKVLQDVADEYGKEYADTLMTYKDVDFTHI